jgi:hypothetical protein
VAVPRRLRRPRKGLGDRLHRDGNGLNTHQAKERSRGLLSEDNPHGLGVRIDGRTGLKASAPEITSCLLLRRDGLENDLLPSG